ncbi:(2Fe-2S)-binding protein [Nocardiopsis sp. NRRL B-16309]|uniref:(2Fe-2S)-binding protein n=1 Tax=Nocardiopsis sp. NRRL B-16309 TaxID=1519494 RepID=UPI0006AFD495|nr:(2Fe-2S)-binding protein [Nocardiopsis sp. NRRL B-16309]KOX15716.1 ferric iron reductase [Nocardiopsis sp. NRRL B-16309]
MDAAGVPVGPVLDDVGRINPFFRVGVRAGEPGLRPVADCTAEEAARQVAHVRERLAAASGGGPASVEWRVAASLFHQGLATRLLAPVLAAGLCHGVLLDARAFGWRPGAPVEPVTRQRRAPRVRGGTAGVADWVHATVVTGAAARVAESLTAAGRVAPGLLRGNTAAALAGAVRALGADRPGVRAAAESVARDLLARPALAGTGGYRGVDAAGLAVFRRSTCCLYYRLPGGGLCGDCALRD